MARTFALEMKKRRSCLTVLVCGFVAFAAYTWYQGFVPLASGEAKAGIRHALDLGILPSSVRVNASGSESWTDYIFEADISISPAQFDRLLSGRAFAQDSDPYFRGKMTDAYRIPDYSGFEIDGVWSWSYRPPDLREGDHGSACTIYASKSRDRAFILYTAD